MTFPNIIIGWQEWVELPSLGVHAICAKTDTGAQTSSLHARNITLHEKDGKKWVHFDTYPIHSHKDISLSCSAPLHDMRDVKSSNGEIETRPVILTKIKIGDTVWGIELNLTNRSSMDCRMLIGREAMQDRLLINPSHKFLHKKLSKQKAKQYYLGPNA